MAEIAGDAWRAEYATAWGEAFGVVAGAMIEGRRPPSAAGRHNRSLCESL